MKMPKNLFDKVSVNDSSVSTDELNNYADDVRPEIRQAIAHHPNAPANLLHKIVTDHFGKDEFSFYNIGHTVALNHAASPRTLELLSNRYEPIDYAISKNPNTSSSTLRDIFGKQDFDNKNDNGYNRITYNILRHSNISANDLDHIIKHKIHDRLLTGALYNPNIRSDQIEKIYNKASEHVSSDEGRQELAYHVVMHPKTPKSVKQKLFKNIGIKNKLLKKVKNEWENHLQ